ncbi:hypothetical protein NADFUDRAFT_83179 [Nadsonia fulvescens var. elongata DSM 6958]|uniref:FAS1 domain-containing protein n=1 Tax=Nadsonia fulvescens var. elongata DSM 6958 TaxID=857566 RepID=A0A1E3PI42_9ASCO|nr:hypothetical protein NADFUDRAFT_83179 [Nadsonia fulvescens var. elongata DSM 6958]
MKLQYLYTVGAFILSTTVAAKSVFPSSRFTVDIEHLEQEDSDLFRRASKDTTAQNQQSEPMFRIQKDAFRDTSLDLQSPDGEQPQTGPTLLRSALVLNADISVFASYLRDDEQLSYRLNDDKGYTLILAPCNDALSQLSAKPWEFPVPIVDTMTELEKDTIARKNIDSFISSHLSRTKIEAGSLIDNGDQISEVSVPLVNGDVVKVWSHSNIVYVKDSAGTTLQVSKIQKASNGEIWILPECLKNQPV